MNLLNENTSPLNSYEQKQEVRKARYIALAENANNAADATASKAMDMAKSIPFGQPIHVGHHSERSDRNFRNKIGKTMDKAINLSDKAEHYARKAEGVGKAGISSDDPDAVKKLKDKLENLEASHALMHAANKALKQNHNDADRITALMALGITQKSAEDLLKPFCGVIGYQSFSFSNSSAMIRNTKKRIADLEKRQGRESAEVNGNGYVYREDIEENRVMFIFEGKPSEQIRTILKRKAFKWSPSRNAWVRQLTGNAQFAARQARAELDAL